MYDLFQGFVDMLFQADGEAALVGAMLYAANALDLNNFAYLAMPRLSTFRPDVISNYPAAWINRYAACHYERIDPVIRHALNHSGAFTWGPDFAPLDALRPEQQLFDEAAQFGIKYGFTIPIHEHDGSIAVITFATSDNRAAFCRSIHWNAQLLRLLAVNFHAHARRRTRAIQPFESTGLSRRQIECLNWAAQGKSTWEIGKIIGVSQRTAAFHLEKAKEKLGARNITQAVARLVATNGLPHRTTGD